MHLVMVPNPAFHPNSNFALIDGVLSLDAQPRLTFGSIGLYDTRMFRDLPRGTRRALSPYYRETIARGLATGESYEGLWENVGTPAQLETLDRHLKSNARQRGLHHLGLTLPHARRIRRFRRLLRALLLSAHICENSPPARTSSACVPRSTMRP